MLARRLRRSRPPRTGHPSLRARVSVPAQPPYHAGHNWDAAPLQFIIGENEFRIDGDGRALLPYRTSRCWSRKAGEKQSTNAYLRSWSGVAPTRKHGPPTRQFKQMRFTRCTGESLEALAAVRERGAVLYQRSPSGAQPIPKPLSARSNCRMTLRGRPECHSRTAQALVPLVLGLLREPISRIFVWLSTYPSGRSRSRSAIIAESREYGCSRLVECPKTQSQYCKGARISALLPRVSSLLGRSGTRARLGRSPR